MRNILRDDAGTSVVSFAICGPVFIALLVPSFGIGAKFIGDLLVSRALDKAVQASAYRGSDDAVKTATCSNLVALSCQGLTVSTLQTFASPDGAIRVIRASKSITLPLLGDQAFYSTTAVRQ